MKLSNLFISISILPSLLLASSPKAPSNLSLKALSSSSVQISWSDNSDDELGFKIFRDDKLIKVLPANVTSYTDSGLSPDTLYKYTVKSTDDTIDEPKLSGVHINEILASNIDVKLDPDFFEFSDYIELKNHENHSIDIGGYEISDGKKSWKIPNNTTIAPNGYLLIWADKRDIKKNGLHTNFKLSSKKQKVILKDSLGNELDKISYKKLPSNISIRSIDDKLVYMIPSPLADNKKVYTKLSRSNKPIFSKSGGFYDSSISISLSSANGSKIYYTTDGSTPTIESKIYTSPINITKSTVIKAISLESGKVVSEVETNSYIIGFDTTLSVISLSIDNRYLFDDYIGIYVEGKNGIPSKGCYYHKNGEPMNFNQDWERPSNIEFFDESGKEIFNIGADLSISGQCSRYNRYGKRSFAVELYDDVKYSLYKDKPNIKSFDDFKIRTGEAGYKMDDVLSTLVVKSGNLNVDYQAYRAVQMFVNGEYWGVYNIREKKGKSFIRANYPDIGKKIDIIAHVSDEDVAKHGNLDEFNKLKRFVESSDLSIDENYQKIQEMIDLDNYIDYMSFMLYCANEDWIYNNTRWWREQKEGAKWRWMLDDVDGSFSQYNFDSFDLATRTSTFMSKLFNNLRRNSEFKSRMRDRLNELLDTTFSQDNIIGLIDRLADERRDYLDLERTKWGITQDMLDYAFDEGREFAKKRKSVMLDLIDKYLQ